MIKKYVFDGDDVAADIREKYDYDGDLAEIYATNRDYEVHKWHHYIPIYDRYFAKYRGTKVKFLEIGVAKGGSLQMWRRFLGEDAVLYGVDLNKRCAEFDGLFGEVRIGSQDDPDFLNKVVDEMDGIDVVLDDGSHKMRHIETSLRTLYPHLAEGGTYMIEDLHAAYWSKFDGGYGNKLNFFNTVRDIVDDMHQRYHHRKYHLPEMDGAVTGLHVHDSIVVIEKGASPMPRHSRVG